MRITVVGVILIVAAVATGVLLLLALKESVDGSDEQHSGGSQQSPSLQDGLGT
jgi:hypothetical protein